MEVDLSMAVRPVPTDATLQSTLEYGKAEFPFACYWDDLGQYQSRCIEWHWHHKFEFSYVLQGEVICFIGGEKCILTAGDALFINSGMIHRFETESQGVLVNYIFAPEFLAETSAAVYLRYVIPVLSCSQGHITFRQEQKENSEILKRLCELNAICQKEEFGQELLIRNIISEIWYYLVQQHGASLAEPSGQKGGRTMERLQTMMNFIHANYHNKLSLDEIAGAANVSKSEALRCFHQVIHSTPIQYLNEYRLGRAREALLTSSETISAVSSAAGFESVGYFCQMFKKNMGCSPGAFRKRCGHAAQGRLK